MNVRVVFALGVLLCSVQSRCDGSVYFSFPHTENAKSLMVLHAYSFPAYFRYDSVAFLRTYFSHVRRGTHRDFEYAVVGSLSYSPYGTVSVSALERDTHQLFLLPTGKFPYVHKEGAVHLSYQKDVNGFVLQLGVNVSDPVYVKPLRGGGQLLYSMNAGFQVYVEPYCLFEFAALNLFKKSSRVVYDTSERFFSALTLELVDGLRVKVSMHSFATSVIQSYFFARYDVSSAVTLSLNLALDRVFVASGLLYDLEVCAVEMFVGGQSKDYFVSVGVRVPFAVNPSAVLKEDRTLMDAWRSAAYGVNAFSGDALIDVNSAGEEELMRLPFVGEKMARRIIKYRKASPFYDKEDLMLVRGIGPRVFQRIKDRVSVSTVTASSFCALESWTMQDFIELGIGPASAFDLVVFIRDSGQYSKYRDLDKLNDISPPTTQRIYDALQTCTQ